MRGSLEAQALDPSSWLITFDDGGVSALQTTADLLEKYGWRGVFFVTTDRIGTPTFLNADHVRELHRRGHVIGSHSCSHPERMSCCGPEQTVGRMEAQSRSAGADRR